MTDTTYYHFLEGRWGVRICPEPPAHILVARGFDEINFEPGGSEGFQLTDTFVWPFEGGRWRSGDLSYGAKALVKQALEAQGYEVVSVQDLSCWGEDEFKEIQRRQELDRKFLEAAEGEDREFLEAIAAEHHGQVALVRLGDVLPHVVMTLRLFPLARVFIVAPSKQEVGKWRRNLGELYSKTVEIDTGCGVITEPQYSVGNFHDLAAYSGHREILLIPDARCLRNKGAATDALYAAQQIPRIYSFISGEVEERELEPRELVEAWSGLVIYKAQRDGQEPKTKTLYWDPPPLTVQVPKEMKALEKKRLLYWHNAPRNRWLADLAQAWAEGDVHRLLERGLLLDGPEQRYLQENKNQQRVTVIVEATEHANEMVKLLHGWKVVTANQKTDKGKQKPKSKPNNTITTISAHARRTAEGGGRNEGWIYAQEILGNTATKEPIPRYRIKPSGETITTKPRENRRRNLRRKPARSKS